jgi:hypothetical protein
LGREGKVIYGYMVRYVLTFRTFPQGVQGSLQRALFD